MNKRRRTIKELPPELRPRERLDLYGAEALSNADLIAIILRTGSRSKTVLEVAEQLYTEKGGLEGLLDCSIEELQKFEGIGKAKAIELKSAIELGKRILQQKSRRGDVIREAKQVYELLAPRLRHKSQETLVAIVLDGRHRLVGEIEVTVGTLNESLAHPREVFREAIRRNAAAIILAHNHPSGDPTPSQDDLFITEQVTKAGQILEIELLDHVIIGDGTFTSLRERRLADFGFSQPAASGVSEGYGSGYSA